jgi:hypothetical protein
LPILRHLKVFITNLVVIEDFPWPMVWWPNLVLVAVHKVIESFHSRFRSSNDNGLISIIDLVTKCTIFW